MKTKPNTKAGKLVKIHRYEQGGAVMRSESTEMAKADRGLDDAMAARREDPDVELGNWGAKSEPGVRERKAAVADAYRKVERVRRETGTGK